MSTRSWAAVAGLAAVMFAFAALFGIRSIAGATARDMAAEAMRQFPGDEVEALMALVASDAYSLADRNRAVYALGRIGDQRALPLLTSLYTGRTCDHSRFLCQDELRKSIDRCSKSANDSPLLSIRNQFRRSVSH